MVNDFLDLIFPPRCVGCGARGAWFCERCAEKTRSNYHVVERCGRCDRPSNRTPCPDCAFDIPNLGGIRIAGDYISPLSEAIKALKFNGKAPSARALGQLLAEAWMTRPGSVASLIVSIPMPADRLRQRGYNPADLLASAYARSLHMPYRSDALSRTREAPPQRTLDADHRRANVIDLFACEPRASAHIRGRDILIVDDVTTTGSTLDAAAAALHAAGATSVWGLALARPLMRNAGI